MVNSMVRERRLAAREQPGGADLGDLPYVGQFLLGDELVVGTKEGIRDDSERFHHSV